MLEKNLSLVSPYNRDVGADVEVGCNFGHKLANVDKFREEAAHFDEYGYYTKHPYSPYPDSPYYKYWVEQTRRSIEGYSIGSDWIPGYYYFYLNFSRIMKVKYKEEDKEKVRMGMQVKGTREEWFPDIWDYDYYYFHYLEEAEKLGKHASVLKSRGKGYSFKGASMLRRNFHLIPKSSSFVFAAEETYLVKDGILNKAQDIGNFINQHTGFFKHSQRHNTLLHLRASHYSNKIEVGFKSEIIGKSLNNKPDKARGVRGKLILYEEAGEFPGLLKAWQIARESVEQDGVTYGLMVAFGTGGSKMVSYKTLNEFFFKPAAYNIHSIDNIWSKKRRENQKTGFFAPSYSNINAFMDKDGNTEVLGAYEVEFNKLENMEVLGTDATAILQRRSERPLRPEDALLRVDGNDFPVRKLDDRLADLLTLSNEVDFSRVGLMKIRNKAIVFEDDLTAPLVRNFPHAKGGNNEGAIEIWDVPAKVDGEVPQGLYIVGVDPYDQDSSETMSLGSCFVMNVVTGMLVAEYTGRPKTAAEYYEQVLYLTMYYNATVNFENNLLGLKWYFEKKGKLGLLEPAPEIIKKMSKVSNDREYGTPGTTNINKYARGLIKIWLLDKIFKDELVQYVNVINSVALLQELSAWDSSNNYDRVSALGMLMILYEAKKGIVGMENYKEDEVYDPAKDSFWDDSIGEGSPKLNIDDLILRV